MATPLQYPVSRRKSLETLWYTIALLTLFSRHMLWDVWCSSCSTLQPYLQDKILSMNEMIAKLSPVSLEPGSHPQNILSAVGKQAGPAAQRWARDPSPWKQVNSRWPRRLLWSRELLRHSMFTSGNLDAMQFAVGTQILLLVTCPTCWAMSNQHYEGIADGMGSCKICTFIYPNCP